MTAKKNGRYVSNKKPGRPSKFTKDRIDKLFYAIRKGATYELACSYAGITFTIYRQWVLKAEEGNDPIFVQFLEDLKEAEAQTALIWLDKIDNAMDLGAWQAAAWKLERRFRQHFGQDAGIIAELQHTFNELKAKLEAQQNK